MDPDYEHRLIQTQIRQRLTTRQHFRSPSSDRFIPTRTASNWKLNFSSNYEMKDEVCDNEGGLKSATDRRNDNITYSCMLKNELLGSSFENLNLIKEQMNNDKNRAALKISRNLFQYQLNNPCQTRSRDSSPYSLSPIGSNSQKLLYSPKRFARCIPRSPYKVLDAPSLQDDFYLNLVDWSAQNTVAVGLESKVYLWNASACEVTLCSDISCISNDLVTSVSFSEKGNLLAIGTHLGFVHIWDVVVNKNLSSRLVHRSRIGVMDWNNDVLASGSRDHTITISDHRSISHISKLHGHEQEICGLKWSPDRQMLASGSNDNKLMLWNMSDVSAIHTFKEHTAAVKAVAWSPHQQSLLASGGGSGDKRIRFWNSLTCQQIHSIDTGSQVCSIAWSKDTNELVSTHGYQQNEILLWRYPSMRQIARLTGHSFRVLYLAMSPDGESIVTGAGDETLRFWKVFPKAKSEKQPKSPLNLFTRIR